MYTNINSQYTTLMMMVMMKKYFEEGKRAKHWVFKLLWMFKSAQKKCWQNLMIWYLISHFILVVIIFCPITCGWHIKLSYCHITISTYHHKEGTISPLVPYQDIIRIATMYPVQSFVVYILKEIFKKEDK